MPFPIELCCNTTVRLKMETPLTDIYIYIYLRTTSVYKHFHCHSGVFPHKDCCMCIWVATVFLCVFFLVFFLLGGRMVDSAVAAAPVVSNMPGGCGIVRAASTIASHNTCRPSSLLTINTTQSSQLTMTSHCISSLPLLLLWSLHFESTLRNPYTTPAFESKHLFGGRSQADHCGSIWATFVHEWPA